MYHPQDGSIGMRGEEWAQTYLKRKGYQILATNYTNPLGRRLGEIDIVAQDSDTIVFIEVKTRIADPRSPEILIPEENITRAKLHKLTKIAEFYLRDSKQFDTPHRFDALALVYSPRDKKVSVKHIENMFYS
ncbi:MAG: YraN family protein [Candidatus Moraniibacteriota bacterium]